jgi:hypothetical protein
MKGLSRQFGKGINFSGKGHQQRRNLYAAFEEYGAIVFPLVIYDLFLLSTHRVAFSSMPSALFCAAF